MENKFSRYICTLWIMSAIFSAVRYIAAAIIDGPPASADSFQYALEATGPFLPIMSTVCLAGGTALLVAEAVLEYRRKKK